MSYTTPPTFVAADILAAADLNILTDDIIDLNARLDETRFSGVSLLRSTAQSIPDNTLTTVSWASAAVDVDNWWTSGTNVVVPAAAIPAGFTTIYVEIQGQARSAANGTGSRSIAFLLNGGTIEAGRATSALSGETTSIDGVVWAEVAAGDILIMHVKQTSGGALNFDFLTMHIKRLGPAS